MKQCENCAEWVEDTYWIEWPAYEGPTVRYYVCQDCLDHLRQWGTGKEPVPEIGSEAAQRDYVSLDSDPLNLRHGPQDDDSVLFDDYHPDGIW